MNLFYEITLESWDDFDAKVKDFSDNWVFRGQADYRWHLETTLEREIEYEKRISYEEFSIRRLDSFKNKININLDTKLEKLSFLQHYGSPTRLIDFSYSPYIASFFATEKKTDFDKAIFAINRNFLVEAVNNYFQEEISTSLNKDIKNKPIWENTKLMDKLLNLDNTLIAFPIDSLFPHKRAIAQKSSFLSNSGLNWCNFERALQNSLSYLDGKSKNEENLIKYIIPKNLRLDFLSSLDSAGINRTYLFPGKDGFVTSSKIEYEILNYHTKEPDN